MPRLCCNPTMVNVAIDYFGRKRVVYIRDDMLSALGTVLATLSAPTNPRELKVANNIPYYFWDADNIDSLGYYSGILNHNHFDFTREVPKWDKIDSAKYVSENKSMVAEECYESNVCDSKPYPAEDYRDFTPYQILIKERARVLKDIFTDPCINRNMPGFAPDESVYDKVDDTDITVLYIYNARYGAARLIPANNAVIYILNALGEFKVINHFKITEMGELGIIQRLSDRIKSQLFQDESAAESYYDIYISRYTSSAIDTEIIREYIRDNYLLDKGEGRYQDIKYNDFVSKIKKLFKVPDNMDISAITGIVYKNEAGLVYKKGAITDKLNSEKDIMAHIQNNNCDDYRYMTEYMDDMMGYATEPYGDLYRCSKLKMASQRRISNKNKEWNIDPLPIEIIGVNSRYIISNNDISCVHPMSDLDAVFQPACAV